MFFNFKLQFFFQDILFLTSKYRRYNSWMPHAYMQSVSKVGSDFLIYTFGTLVRKQKILTNPYLRTMNIALQVWEDRFFVFF